MLTALQLKGLFAQAALTCSLLDGLAYLRFRERAFILMYHRVIHDESREAIAVEPGMYVSVETFRVQTAFLAERFNVLPLAELVARIRSGRSVGGCCALTFDDGWRDNYTGAFPVLQEYQLPATVFLASGFVGTNRLFWPEELAFYLREPGLAASVRQSRLLERFFGEVARAGGGGEILEKAVRVLKTWMPPERTQVLEHLRAVCPAAPVSPRLLMNWREAAEMQASGLISFGAHTVNHVILDQVELRHAEEEIIRSSQELEIRLGTRPEFFAYPNGNFNLELQAIVKRHGFAGALTTRRGWLEEGAPLFDIPRIGMHDDVSRTIPLFLARIVLERF
jgi:peptidoglycan/xylan/chitin deacetylase (PgdA/CDA1 family)